MRKYLLSICIPVYNNIELLKKCIEFILIAVSGYEEVVEIVISDNASEDEIKSYINKVICENQFIRINYSRNDNNIGLAGNFHRIVEIATGAFCWIIGSDDFILKNSVKTVLDVINEHKEISFISVAHSRVFLTQVYDKKHLSDPYHKLESAIYDGDALKFSACNKNANTVIKWDNLVDPIYDNVFFGAVMTGVFKRELWMSVDRSIMDRTANFDNVENIYPHCAVFSKCMINKKAYYINKNIVAAGEGARTWEGENYWNGALPIIHLKVLNQLIDYYKEGGLKQGKYIKCRVKTCKNTGRYLYEYLSQKREIKGVSLKYIFSRCWYCPAFYYGLLKGLLKHILLFIRSLKWRN